MSDRIHCDKHGETKQTMVCAHIVQTVRDKEPRGFAWCLANDGFLYADCTSCNALSSDEWHAQADENGRILCFGCFQEAASLNGVALGDQARSYLQ